MAAAAASPTNEASDTPHVPVLIDALIGLVSPVSGTWIDGTFGAGGYSRALLEAGADRVLGIDRDPDVFEMARDWAAAWGERLVLAHGTFGKMDEIAAAHGMQPAEGVVLDLGVSSMQLDRPERGFSFMRPGPLDMRMGQEGPSAADLVNTADEKTLADIIHFLGEERAARRIARAIVRARAEAPITTTERLAEIVAACLPRPKPGQIHPATRTFQAIRIWVNDELGELVRGLAAAERVLAPGGWLAVVTFHSLEDRIVKRFFQLHGGRAPGQSRHAPAVAAAPAAFEIVTRRPVTPSPEEAAANPRARSARLRAARRTSAPPLPVDAAALGMPPLKTKEAGR